MKKYSVLIPAYNVEAYIAECVESVMKQVKIEDEEIYDSVEIVIANDGSNDSTGEICDELEKKYSNIKVFHKKNEGPLLTREFLVKKASAQYLIYLDADDKWEDNLLNTLNGYIEKYNYPDIISFGFNLWKGENYLPYDRTDEKFYCDKLNYERAWGVLLCGDNYNSVWSKAIKKEILMESYVEQGMKNIRRGEDKLKLIACFEKAQSILFIPDQLYDYRIDNVSMTRKFDSGYFSEIISVDKYALEKLKEYTSGTEEYLVKWGENVIDKFIDYVRGAFENLQRHKAIECINEYLSDETIKNAIYYAKKSKKFKTKVKTYIISKKLYKIWRL